MKLDVTKTRLELAEPFRISQTTYESAEIIQVTLREGVITARGEATGVDYLGETSDTMVTQIEAVRADIEAGIDRGQLQDLLDPGGARNAIDCAMWMLEARRAGISIWAAVGIEPRPVISSFTLGVDTPERMAAAALTHADKPLLKLKISARSPIECVSAVRAARPDATIIVDANEALDADMLRTIAPRLADLDVAMIEQPLAAGKDDDLLHYDSPVPLCADESCQTVADLDYCEGRYAFVNIKLDKTGGLTHALTLVSEARARGFKLMVGCMLGTSLGMAPGFVVAQSCQFVDLDAPTLLSRDIDNGIVYRGGDMHVPPAELWA